MNLTRALLLIVCLLLPGIASGQSTCGPDGCGPDGCPPQDSLGWPATARRPAVKHSAVVKVISTRGDGQKHGSGTLVYLDNGPGLVVTCAHILGSGFDTVVVFPSGARRKATILATDALRDCALLSVSYPAGTKGMPLAKTLPRQGERVTWIGYGGNRYGSGTAIVVSYEGDMLAARGRVREGDSGGPLCTAAGLVGVVIEQEQEQRPGAPWVIKGPHAVWIRQFIERSRARRIAKADPPPKNDTWRPPPPLVAVTPPVPAVEPKESAECIELRARIVALEKLVAALKCNVQVRPLIVKRVNTVTGEETIEEINFQDGEGLIFLMTPHQ